MQEPSRDIDRYRHRQERQRRRRELVVIILTIVLVIGVTSLLIYLTGRRGEALLPQNILVFILINVNAILLLLLMYLVVRNFVKLFFERRKGILGSKLRTKLVGAFVGLSLVPTVLMFWVSIGFITNTIENWFSFKVERSLEQALNVVEIYYRHSAENALHYATQISTAITEGRLLNQKNLDELRTLVARKQAEYNLGVVEVFSAQREELLRIMNPSIPDRNFISADSSIVQQALEGRRLTRIQPIGEGDIVRGVVPVYSTWNPRDIVGVVIVNYYNPQSLVSKMDSINRAFQEFKQLKLSKDPIKGMYVILFSAVTLLIIFSATWFGFHLSRVISVPIGTLADATQQIAHGNLDITLEPGADDEIGSLIASFNRMTRDLRASKQQVEITTANLRDTIRELEHRRLYIETLLDNVAAVVLSVDHDGCISTFNKSAERMFGIRMEDVVGRPYREVLGGEALHPLRDCIHEIISYNLQFVERQVTLAFPDRTVFLYLRSNMLFDADGQYRGLVIIAEDLTQIQQAQRAFAWREVARRIAHEIKNPLTPIKLSAQRLRKKFQPQVPADAAVFEQCTQTIINQVDELKTLVNEFSNFARMPATNPVPGDLRAVIEETLALYREAHKGITFVFRPHASEIRLSFDRTQIKRVLINLLDNAVDSMENGGTVTIATSYNRIRNVVVIEVADTGTGIPPEIKQRMFEPYFSTKKTGTGLGLAIVTTIISDHGGYIRVRDNHPRGACFIIELPVTQIAHLHGDLHDEKTGHSAG
ncbi:MAG: ATP-binding protein [Desulfobacterota bacterium]|nr:ATP-binding protein [Thermodesulfobacteriota bacterium]